MIRLLRNPRNLKQIQQSTLNPLPIQSSRKSTTSEDVTETKTAPMDGAEACANASYALSECAFIYPITPSTQMSESFDEWSVSGRKSVIGEIPVAVHEMQSEAGAVGAMHGASVSGALATTFTASQGLLLMIPNLYQFSGELIPAVFHVAARSLTKQALSIFGDHQDVMACRQTGVALLCSNNPQEAQDLSIISHIATIKSRIPFIHFFDGWRTSSTVHKIKLFNDEQIKQIYPYDELETNLRNTGININEANMRGTAQGPDIYFQSLVANNKYYAAAPDVIQKTMDDFKKIFGREYNLFDYYGNPNAERVIIMMGSGADTVEQTIDEMNGRGENVGLVKVRLFRPWSASHFINKLPSSIKKIAVLDRTREDGAQAQPLHLDITMSLQTTNRLSTIDVLTGGQYGLSSKEFTPSMIRSVYGNLNKSSPKNNYVVGIVDDITNTSLDYSEYDISINNDIPSSLPSTLTQAMFWGMGGDGTVGANKQSIKDVSNNTSLYTQAYFAYTAHKSGGVTISHLRFGPEPIKAEYEIRKADYISVNHSMWIQKFDQIVNKAKFGATLVLNSNWKNIDEISEKIPDKIKKIIAIKNMKFYNIDAAEIAQSVGLGKRINQLMQSVFYKLSGVLPEEEALDIMRKSIQKLYHDKGPKVIDMNLKAVDKGLDGLTRVDYPQNEWAALKVDDESPIEVAGRDYSQSTPKFVKEIMYSMADMTANELPVSAFTAGGAVPQATAKYERRAISSIFPAWDSDKCTQCNYCSLVCPHAVIRPFLLNKEEIHSAPQGYISRKTKPSLANTNYSIQIAPMDCTGCEVCTQQCPDSALSMVSYSENVDSALEHWEYSVNNITNKEDLLFKDSSDQTNRLSVKGSQFYQPLCEFHGACAGCGESPYLKLVTQMFGKNVVIANATGCSSIWGASAPNNPYSVPWANSLFEDNAEFGYGMTEAANLRRHKLYEKLSSKKGDEYTPEINAALKEWVVTYNDMTRNNIASDKIYKLLSGQKALTFEILASDKNMLKKSINWIVGGDGWAYDIGFGGLDHVFAQGSNVNILVLDTEMYSNTGGQASKSTPTGASVKFASGGMQAHKKDLGQIAMLYKNIYVSSIALGADYEQTVSAMKEAESYNGTSVLIALAPCIDWGIDMKDMMKNQKMAVDTGYWPLYRYDPRRIEANKNPFQLDSKRIREDLQKYLKLQNRFGKLERSNPVTAARLQTKLHTFNIDRHEKLLKHSLDDEAYFDYLQNKLHKTGDDMAHKKPKTLVLYGSETGNARTLSDVIMHELKRRNVDNLQLVSMDDYDFNELYDISADSQGINLIFAISTCGQGELPKNCQYFMKELLDSKLRGKELSSRISYAVFGLGDSSYVYFNEAAKILDEKLKELGATQLIECGLGDDGDEDGYDEQFEEWIPDLYNKLECDEASDQLLDSIFKTNILDSSAHSADYHPSDCIADPIKLITNKRLTRPEYDRDFRHYEFDITGNSELSFDVGDCLGISPINDFEIVNKLCDIYNIKENDILEITKEGEGDKSNIITAFDLFSRKLDIQGKPKRRFYELLSQVATNPDEQKYLNHLLSNEGASELKSLKLNDTPNYIDLLSQFPSCRPDINYLIEYIPDLKQRLYSIANSPQMTPNQIDLFVVKDDWTTKTNNIYKEGVCTKYLENLTANNSFVNGKIHGASVTIAETHEHPLVLAGLGSGLAPLRAHIQDRVYAASKGETVGECALIFGSRNQKDEYFYQDELEDYHKNGKGILTHLLPAFSRDQDKKYYVTNQIEDNGKMIYDYLVEKNGYFYYCGQGGSVPTNIKHEIINAFAKYGNMNKEQAEQKVIDMQLNGHYNVEAW